MAQLTALKERVTRSWRRQQQEYAHGENFPLGGYTAAMSVYGGLVAALTAAVRLSGTPLPDRISPWDTAQTAVATHKLSRDRRRACGGSACEPSWVRDLGDDPRTSAGW
jgi:hypothetical protein